MIYAVGESPRRGPAERERESGRAKAKAKAKSFILAWECEAHFALYCIFPTVL